MAGGFDLKPTSRGEEFLDVILRSLGGDTPDIPQPAWRYEEYLAAIANAIQNGGGGGGGGALVVNLTIDTGSRNATADKTAAEIWAAAQSGVVVFTGSTAYLGFEGTFMRPLVDISHSDDGYGLTLGGSAFDLLIAATGSDYPAGTLN